MLIFRENCCHSCVTDSGNVKLKYIKFVFNLNFELD